MEIPSVIKTRNKCKHAKSPGIWPNCPLKRKTWWQTPKKEKKKKSKVCVWACEMIPTFLKSVPYTKQKRHISHIASIYLLEVWLALF